VQAEDRIQTITPGRARGRLVGGNLTVLSAIVGTPYVPDLDGAILFLEDTGEAVYRMDRMLTHLKLAGLLGRLRGFVFGRCTDCEPGEGYGALTLDEVLADHVRPLGVPAFRGAMIGHIDRQFTVPVGLPAEIDADAGTIRLLEPAVA
jgi:muramoyltetrapeptide carboxypeptidase